MVEEQVIGVNQEEVMDITPTPRILRTLGEIPFQSWQCLAELIDNSIDAFRLIDDPNVSKRMVVSWSSAKVPGGQRQVELVDNGLGLSLSEIQNSVRAGYSSNNPLTTLGLFGMGFNIATARLGEKTQFLSATKDSSEWVGVEIDFNQLSKQGTFRAPVIRYPKSKPEQHGTKIIVSQLRPGISDELIKNEASIRKTLSNIYSPILKNLSVEFLVLGKILEPYSHCVWDQKRYVSIDKGKTTVPAIIPIDITLGDALFDLSKMRYLAPEEEDEFVIFQKENGTLPGNIVRREKKISGWLGIQRYSDPSDFGIDFIRNGRKILIKDKSLFSYRNPITGTDELEYPVELGTTTGGRIVGEIHMDFMQPTYQKNDFDRNTSGWFEIVQALRGDGPIRPTIRKAMGFNDENTSPISLLIMGYGRPQQGTKFLFAPNQTAKDYTKKFYDKVPEYITDEKWYEAAREADRQAADKNARTSPVVDTGDTATDDASIYLPQDGDQTNGSNLPNSGGLSGQGVKIEQAKTAGKDDKKNILSPDTIGTLKSRSKQSVIESKDYYLDVGKGSFSVNVWEVTTGIIRTAQVLKDEGVPSALFKDGNKCEYFYNPRHPFLRDYPISHLDLLLIELAERFKVRDQLTNVTDVYISLIGTYCQDRKIERSTLQEDAKAFFDLLRGEISGLLSSRELEVIEFVHEALGDVEEIISLLFNNPDLLENFQQKSPGAINALELAPARTLVRLVEKFPEEFFDGNFFSSPYKKIQLSDPNSTERLRGESRDRIISFLRDALWVVGENSTTPLKYELERCARSLKLLEGRLAQ